MAEKNSHSICKYVKEVICPQTFTCVECFKEEDVWIKRWVRYLRLKEDKRVRDVKSRKESKLLRAKKRL